MLDWAFVGLWTLLAAYCSVRVVRDVRSGIASPDDIRWPKRVYRRHQPVFYWCIVVCWAVGFVASGWLAIATALEPGGLRELLG